MYVYTLMYYHGPPVSNLLSVFSVFAGWMFLLKKLDSSQVIYLQNRDGYRQPDLHYTKRLSRGEKRRRPPLKELKQKTRKKRLWMDPLIFDLFCHSCVEKQFARGQLHAILNMCA